ncbi:hypothetical protein [Streptomyces sp. IB201691-2A2]|uniref:hypothetical protein n=1 Tax=Streptomyces sp. IB201691-2A2 TaxID=2561920 RepID=UPI0011803638|nr:hypothetical protein [Streptomyces sp. IB201691-2A2]TRO56216.1 hypothetical protein E4K73_47480 [Streptomyces sp. IB201691-2A2]
MTAQIIARTRPDTAGTEDANRRLGAHLLEVVRRQDAAIPAERRAPRTVAQMQARLTAAAQEDVCPMCEYWQCRCGQASTAPADRTAHEPGAA